MNIIVICLLISYLNTFSNAEIVCKDTNTNMEYIAKDTDIDERLTNLSRTFELKINEITKFLDNRLNGQMINFTEMEKTVDALNERLKTTKTEISTDLETRFNRLEEMMIRTLMPTNCKEATKYTQRSGIYKIQCPAYSPEAFEVACDAKSYEGGWTVVLRRFDGSVDFYRNWNDYKMGFGQLTGEFFIGLDKLHAMTSSTPKQELLVILKQNTDIGSETKTITKYAKYNSFIIGNEDEAYKIKELGEYTGNASSALRHHLGQKFTTKDRDNDDSEQKNCAILYTGAWWFKKCYHCHLFGKYFKDDKDDGIHWSLFEANYTNLQFAEMLIRPVS